MLIYMEILLFSNNAIITHFEKKDEREGYRNPMRIYDKPSRCRSMENR